MPERYIGIDVGSETVKIVEIVRDGGALTWTGRHLVEHEKEPGAALLGVLSEIGWDDVSGAAVVGRAGRTVHLRRIPTKEAQAAGFRHLYGEGDGTVVSIGSHGFSVLELRASGVNVFRENSRCSQGTGNFLRQLVERFNLTVEEASALCESVDDPSPLSGRCPVILKTDMTHLANKGNPRENILAGLYDAVCENVQVLIKPTVSPPRVVLGGGVSRSRRVRDHFRSFLERHGMELLDEGDDRALFLDALGCALDAAERPVRPPPLEKLLAPAEQAHFERLPGLSGYLGRVKRMRRRDDGPTSARGRALILGFDIGSTGSKVVALDRDTRSPIWEAYVNTNGDPVGAAQTLMRKFVESEAREGRVVAIGATGSGREIVGSLLSTCYGPERIYVLNEIAAHAEGALHYDARVDTIFEIGGQDAKYIRLAEGRVVDAAMNEACSAGTGSFIEEQGRKFSGIRDVVQLGEAALGAERGVSLGQHCSVFMAEIIDEAVAAGVDTSSVVAGIYSSIVQNYLNRVKGSREVGQVVFCQGMPFCSDALAAAVARETGSEVIVPPSPGTVGALGIALLTRKVVSVDRDEDIDPAFFLGAEVARKDTFVCKSTKGCGGSGNRCRIDRIATVVDGQRQRFTWGGSCSLWDKGTGKTKLPDRAPDPFREREALVQEVVEKVTRRRGARKTVAMTDEFQLKGLFPFFATFVHELGFDVVYEKSAGHKMLKRGIEEANVPFCAPMQLYHGLVGSMAEHGTDFLFVPMLREMRRSGSEPHAIACPIVQASPDVLRLDLGKLPGTKLVSPVLDFGEDDLESLSFMKSCQAVALALGSEGIGWWSAYQVAKRVQDEFDEACRALGERALEFCEREGIVPVVVLGRPYTIYNPVLNSNVPPLLREQGAIAIPIDCYPVDETVPVVNGVYWAYGQYNLRAAYQVRRAPGVYAIWCSNYSCGPDSFNLHFYAYAMTGKPFAVIETDGHAGDAGTKTRVEAFLHCVREDLASGGGGRRTNDLTTVARGRHSLEDIRRRRERVLFPRMGDGAETVAACLRGTGVPAEALPMPDREALRAGRRYTSGKECVPMCVTLGSLLQRLEQSRDTDERFTFFMPTADGPCRFGVYNILHRIVLERLGWADRVKIWSPVDSGYFDGLPSGFAALVVTGFAAHDLIQQALFDVRPVETRPGAAQAIYDHYFKALLQRLEDAGQEDLSLPAALLQVGNGRLFGVASLLRRAAAEFRAVSAARDLPTVLVVGEIYVRLDPFTNDFVVDKLEQRGLRVRFAPFSEWLEYSDYMSRVKGQKFGFSAMLSTAVQRRIQNRTYDVVAEELDWPERTTVAESIDAARPYVREELAGEAVLTVGGGVHEWRAGLIDGVVSVGPLECMPNKISEAQYFHAAEREGLASLTIPVNGDGIDPEALDAFAFEVQGRFRSRRAGEPGGGARSARPERAAARRRLPMLPKMLGPLGPRRD